MVKDDSPRTLVVHVGGIGDLILTFPALRALSKLGPVEIAGPLERAQLAVDAGCAVAAHDLDAIGLYSAFSSPAPSLRSFLQNFQRAVVWMRDPDEVLKKAFGKCGVYDFTSVAGIPPPEWEAHASEYFLEQLGVHAGDDLVLRPRWNARNSRGAIIHPGSGAAAKNWDMNNFLQVAQALKVDCEWILGPAEEGLKLSANARVAPRRTLSELSGRLAKASLYVGNDSGVSHLAGSMGCPTIAVFGVTDPRIWEPLGPRVRVMGPPWPAPDDVIAQAKQLLRSPG